MIWTLPGINQTKHQVFVLPNVEQEQQFQVLFQAWAKDRQVLQSLVQLMGTPEATLVQPTGCNILSMVGLQDNPEAFVKLFEHAAEP